MPSWLFMPLPAHGTLSDLAAGNYHALLTGVSITDDRDRLIDFTQPYILPNSAIFVTLTNAD